MKELRGQIFRSSYKRARRAISEGFYLEAIVIIESLLADRLESVLSAATAAPVQFRTANEAARDLRGSSLIDQDLLARISSWSYGRSRWVHEFAKVSDEDHLTWHGRLADARDVALSGFDLVTQVTAAAKKAKSKSTEPLG